MQVLVASRRQTLPDVNQRLPTGLDVGNGAVKLVLPGYEVRIPSYITSIHGSLHDPPDAGLVSYLDGANTDLIGQSWLTGQAAYQYQPEGYLKVVDDRYGKLNYSLPLLLGILSHMPYHQQWALDVVASIHHRQTMGGELIKSLQGLHVVRFNAYTEPSTVQVRVLKVLDEGVGAIASCTEADTTNQTLMYDLGNGTVVVSVFGPKGRLIDRQVSTGGVQSLVDAIAKNQQVIRKLAHEGDRQVIRTGIEQSSFLYGVHGAWSFEEIYRSELKPWIVSTLKPALKVGAKWMPTSTAVIAIGGGTELPMVRELLLQQGICPVKGAAWANARGLQRIAEMLEGRND